MPLIEGSVDSDMFNALESQIYAAEGDGACFRDFGARCVCVLICLCSVVWPVLSDGVGLCSLFL